MKYKAFYLCSFLLISCCTNRTIKERKLIHINVYYEEYTGSLDAIISNNPFDYPDSIKRFLADTSMSEIMLEGKNPYASRGVILNFFSENRLKNRYNLFGYFSRIDSTNNPVGKVPVFNVVKWEKVKSKK